MLLRKHEKYNDGSIQTCFATYTCKYCGKTFIKFQNKTLYCSDDCRKYSNLEHTCERVRQFRKRYKNVTQNNNWIGTGHLGNHTSGDWETEKLLIFRERKRLKLKT